MRSALAATHAVAGSEGVNHHSILDRLGSGSTDSMVLRSSCGVILFYFYFFDAFCGPMVAFSLCFKAHQALERRQHQPASRGEWREGFHSKGMVTTSVCLAFFSFTFCRWKRQALEQYLKEDSISLPVQVNGKVRATVQLPVGASEEEAKALAMEQDNVKRSIGDKSVKKVIYVTGRILNIVVK